MTLTASIRVSARAVDARIEVPAGSTLALLGPNGSGKSTILEALAGLLPIDDGAVTHGGTTLVDTATGVDIPARDRRVAFVSQADALFDSMTVLENVAFGSRARGTARGDARIAALEWLDRVGAAELADRRPHALSGGQARRVSIARALATTPRLILLDEPFAGLDLESATAIRALIREVLGGITTVVATHAALDAHVLADAVAVLDGGRVAEHGATVDVLARPLTRFAARMAGRVLLVGTVTKSGLALDVGGAVAIAQTELPPGAHAAVAVHPRDVDITATGLADVVTALEPHGDLVRVHGAVLAADVEPAAVLTLRPGDPIRFSVRGEPSAYAI